MTVGKVKDFNFSSSGKTVGLCNGSMTKMASGGYYAKGGKAIGGPITEEMTGETYPSRSAMVKHESMETPRMQKQEMVQKSTVRAPALKLKAGRAAAGKAAIAPQMPMKKGGFVERGTGMIPSKGTLGVKNNKNPGEMGGKAPIKSHPKYNFAEGGPVQKYADGGQAMPKQGALQAMRAAMANRGAQGRMPPQNMPQRTPPQGMPQQGMPTNPAVIKEMLSHFGMNNAPTDMSKGVQMGIPAGYANQMKQMPPQGMAAPMGQREAQAMMQQRMQQMPQGMPPKGMPSRGMPPQGSPPPPPAMRGMKKGGSTSMNKINISPALTKAIINAKMK